MKVAIFSPYATVAPHFETELEIAERHFQGGDSVEYVACTGDLPNCDFNPSGDRKRCEDCLGRRRDGLRMLSQPISFRKLPRIDPNDPAENCFELPIPGSIADLRVRQLDQFDIGQAVLSSLISMVRNPSPDLDRYHDLWVRLWISAASTYLAARRYMLESGVQRVYVFNGRFAATRAVLRAAQLCGVDCFIHERGCDLNHFELYRNHLPHDIGAVENLIREKWQAAPIRSRSQSAAQWFLDRRNRVESTWHSFTRGQQLELLPCDFDPSRHNLAVFCSSEDEFASIGDCWRNTLFPDQAETIDTLAARLADRKDVHIYLRTHPNLAQADPTVAAKFLRLSHANLTVIEPEAKVDSYALMTSCATTVTFGSTMGIEAAYWGKPSILLGPCFYRGLGGTYQPNTVGELLELCVGDIAPIESEAPEMYGYWQKSHGLKYEFVQPVGLFDALFKGQRAFARGQKTSGFHKFKRWFSGGQKAAIESV